jgi:hypothetical protein
MADDDYYDYGYDYDDDDYSSSSDDNDDDDKQQQVLQLENFFQIRFFSFGLDFLVSSVHIHVRPLYIIRLFLNCTLFYDAVSNSDLTAPDYSINELDRIWKELIVG